MSDTLGVALTKELCPVCLKEQDGAILLNQILTKSKADEVKELHGKVIGIAKTICAECKDKIQGGIYLIAIDEDKSIDMSNPYRTGKYIGITETAFRDMTKHGNIENIESIIAGQICYVPDYVINSITND